MFLGTQAYSGALEQIASVIMCSERAHCLSCGTLMIGIPFCLRCVELLDHDYFQEYITLFRDSTHWLTYIRYFHLVMNSVKLEC
jgi:hypothetical protein